VIQKISFMLHFDASELPTNLYASVDLEDLFAKVLASTSLADSLTVSDSITDEGVAYWGDADFSDPVKFGQALMGEVAYGIVSCSFPGFLSAAGNADWSEVRQQLLKLRSEVFEAKGMWSEFIWAPVGLSVVHLETEASGAAPITVTNRPHLLQYIDTLEAASVERQDIASFLSFYSPEISRFKAQSDSHFVEAWLATELLLTQKSLSVIASSDSHESLLPNLRIDEFDWTPPNALPNLLAAERAMAPAGRVWLSPLPKNPYSESSTFWYDYQDVSHMADRVNPNGFAYSAAKAVLLTLVLSVFADEFDVDDVGFDVETFIEDNRDLIDEVVELVEDQLEWDSGLEIGSDHHDFIEQTKLPEELRDFWSAWLNLIGRDVG